jgi:dTDP-4-amino-4,6-dideoxygalactose transaminase
MEKDKNQVAILGGPTVRSKPFPERRCIGSDERNAVLEVLDSQVLSDFIASPGKYFNGGRVVKKFESIWSEKYNFKHAISVNSWTSGLMSIVGAIGIEPGDEVICSPYTMSASATCVLFYGGIPVFADIEEDTYCIDPKSIEAKITKRTKAIIVVHLFGGTADMDQIMNIADKNNIIVVEDAAQAPGVLYNGKPVGTIGHIGGFSLNYHKHIHSGEGGLIVTNDDNLALRCRMIRNHGENYADAHPELPINNTIGGNYRFSELHAAIAIEQFKKLPDILRRRNNLARHLSSRLSGISGIKTPKVRKNCTHAWYLFPLQYEEKDVGISRALFVDSVNAELPKPKTVEDVALTQGYVRPLYKSRVYQEKIAIGTKGFPFNINSNISYSYSDNLCPVTEKMYSKKLLLTGLVRDPLTIKDIDDLADAIIKVIRNSHNIGKNIIDNYSNKVVSTVDVASKT